MSKSLFQTVAPTYMSLLMADFGCSLDDAAAVFGNLGYESGGFKSLQEVKPTVKGSRGGYGWAQWTGPRRKKFEAYCGRHNLRPEAHETNYKYLFVELSTDYRSAIAAVKAAPDLFAKVKAFEQKFEQAGVKHYPERLNWAVTARVAWLDANPTQLAPASTLQPAPEPAPIPPPPDVPPVEPAPSTGGWIDEKDHNAALAGAIATAIGLIGLAALIFWAFWTSAAPT